MAHRPNIDESGEQWQLLARSFDGLAASPDPESDEIKLACVRAAMLMSHTSAFGVHWNPAPPVSSQFRNPPAASDVQSWGKIWRLSLTHLTESYPFPSELPSDLLKYDPWNNNTQESDWKLGVKKYAQLACWYAERGIESAANNRTQKGSHCDDSSDGRAGSNQAVPTFTASAASGNRDPNYRRAKQDYEHVIVLIHGIRDIGAWQSKVSRNLEHPGTTVEQIRFGLYPAVRFLFPINLSRGPVNKVIEELRELRDEYKNAEFSAIAHSFGTYVLLRAMSRDHHIKLRKIVFCGSVADDQFKWGKLKSRIGDGTRPTKDFIVNDCGTGDVWPVLGAAFGLYYGLAGVTGFTEGLVTNRFHRAIEGTKGGHGLYFHPEFVRQKWKPFLINDEAPVDGDGEQGEHLPYLAKLLYHGWARLICKCVLLLVWLAIAGAIGVGLHRLYSTVSRPERAFVCDKTLRQIIDTDLRRLDVAERPYAKYFSLVHLWNSTDITDEQLQLVREEVSNLINSHSSKRRMMPAQADKDGLVLRIDLRDYGWSNGTQWLALLSEYPWGFKESGEQSERSDRDSELEIPCLRADWFVHSAARPPLYDRLVTFLNEEEGERDLQVPRITTAARLYCLDLKLADVARELGLPNDPNVAREAGLKTSAELAILIENRKEELGSLLPLTKGESITREQWERAFPKMARALNLIPLMIN